MLQLAIQPLFTDLKVGRRVIQTVRQEILPFVHTLTSGIAHGLLREVIQKWTAREIPAADRFILAIPRYECEDIKVVKSRNRKLMPVGIDLETDGYKHQTVDHLPFHFLF